MQLPKEDLSYLKGTADVGLLLGKGQTEKENRLSCFVDSAYGRQLVSQLHQTRMTKS